MLHGGHGHLPITRETPVQLVFSSPSPCVKKEKKEIKETELALNNMPVAVTAIAN
jgi:hypothetical protein